MLIIKYKALVFVFPPNTVSKTIQCLKDDDEKLKVVHSDHCSELILNLKTSLLDNYDIKHATEKFAEFFNADTVDACMRFYIESDAKPRRNVDRRGDMLVYQCYIDSYPKMIADAVTHLFYKPQVVVEEHEVSTMRVRDKIYDVYRVIAFADRIPYGPSDSVCVKDEGETFLFVHGGNVDAFENTDF